MMTSTFPSNVPRHLDLRRASLSTELTKVPQESAPVAWGLGSGAGNRSRLDFGVTKTFYFADPVGIESVLF
jgi:hypothetical protein